MTCATACMTISNICHSLIMITPRADSSSRLHRGCPCNRAVRSRRGHGPDPLHVACDWDRHISSSINTKLAAIALLPMIALVLLTSSFGTKIGKLFFAVDNAVGDVSNRLQENVVGIQVVRAFRARVMRSIALIKPTKRSSKPGYMSLTNGRRSCQPPLVDHRQRHPDPVVRRTNGYERRVDDRRNRGIQRLHFDAG